MEERPAYPGAPRWVKVSAILGGVLVLLIAVLIFAGGGLARHGPGRHASGNDAPSSHVTDDRPGSGHRPLGEDSK